MRFRTEIEPQRTLGWIEPGTAITLLGSCFSDNIGERLVRDGFDCIHNPLGPLFNPLSISRAIELAMSGGEYLPDMLEAGPRGWHCMDFASRYSGNDPIEVCSTANGHLRLLSQRLQTSKPHILALTLGSAFVYMLDGKRPVGNCHKFPAQRFERIRLDVDRIVDAIASATRSLSDNTKIILTVSPVRHLDDGLHGNTLSKAILHLACEQLVQQNPKINYFPAYEMLMDDLRDYRFYADDLKHPSAMACEYIYSHFCDTYMTAQTREYASRCRKEAAQANHRPILSN